MSLNRIEEQLYGYLQRHPEERQYIIYKVHECAQAASHEQAASLLIEELSAYYNERCYAVSDFASTSTPGGAPKMSLRNLAEYLLRTWGPVKNVKSMQG